MAVCQLLILTVTLLLCVIQISGATVSTDNTTRYYVKPNDTSPCPYHPCKTLAEYALDPGRYFTSHTRIIFLPGNHSLNTILVVGNVTRLALAGPGGSGLVHAPARIHADLFPGANSSSVVTCTVSKSGMLFENVSNLVLEDLTFTGCENVSSRCSDHSALAFIYITDLLVSGISIHNSSGVGFCGHNLLGSPTIQHSVFACNHGNAVNNEGNVNMLLFYTNCSNIVVSHQLLITSSHFLNGSNNPYMSKSSASGLDLVMECTNVAVTIENSTFLGNTGYLGGNIRIALNNESNSFTEPVIIQNCTIINGTADEGGGMHISVVEQPQVKTTNCSSDHHIHVLNTTFSGNIATSTGGGLYFAHLQTANFYCTSLRVLVRKCVFTFNTRRQYMAAGGVAFHISNQHTLGYLSQGVPQAKIEIENCNFSNNRDKTDQGISAAVYVEGEYSVSISDSILLTNNCTAITAVNSEILFEGSITIRGNGGSNGGGIALCDRSHMYFKPYTSLLLADNRASGKGGAIYAVENCLQAKPTCFFQIVTEITQNHMLLKTVNVTIMNNSAVVAGDAVYSGSIDYCYLLFEQHTDPSQHNFHSSDIFNTIFNPHVQPGDISFISSNPVGVCLCNNGTPVCDKKSKALLVFPGQTLQQSAVAVGQRNGAVPGNVVATAIGCNITNTQEIQYIPHSTCSTLFYTVRTDNRSASITLGVQGAKNFNPPVINLTIIDCPIGFTYIQQQCQCNSYLMKRKVSCDINNSVIHRIHFWWVGACPHNTSKETHVAIVYCSAAVGYCSPGAISIPTTSSSIESDVQCAPHRTGTACGACKPGYSLTLGGNQCRKCSNKYIPVVLSFAVGGLLLVVILTALNLTVTEGAINGLIFYANIVQANARAFFPALPANPVLKVLISITQVLIAWLNLDVGIEMCFYDGLDAYTRTWLQFAFPIYIWVIAGAIVFLSRRYTIMARATGRHAVQVLATLFLLSFAKLLSTIIASCSFISLKCKTKVTMWLPDGNIEYLQGKHTLLFVAALVAAICIVAPYTVILVFVQCLQRVHLGLISRIKPIIDAYTGPYKDNCRFWTGHSLVIRIILFIVAAGNDSSTSSMTFIVVACVHMLLLSVWMFRGVYRRYVLDILESSFTLNLAVLSVNVLYYRNVNKAERELHYNTITALTLFTIALLTFVGVVFFQAYRQLSGLSIYHALKAKVLKGRQIHSAAAAEREPLVTSENNSSATASSNNEALTSPQRPAQQPVLAPMRRFDQYREPVLGFEDST